MGELVYEAVARTAELPDGARRVVEVGGRPVLLFSLGGSYYAVPNGCPHRRWPLSESSQCATTVKCPRHGWEFDVVSGRGIWPPFGYRLRHLPLRVVDETIEVAWTEPEVELAR